MASLQRIEGELVELGTESASGPMQLTTAMAFRTAAGGREELPVVHVPESLRPRLGVGTRGVFYFTPMIGFRAVSHSLFAVATETGTAIDCSEVETLTGGRFVRVIGYGALVLGALMLMQVLWSGLRSGGMALLLAPLPLLFLALGAFILWWIPSPDRMRAFVKKDRAETRNA